MSGPDWSDRIGRAEPCYQACGGYDASVSPGEMPRGEGSAPGYWQVFPTGSGYTPCPGDKRDGDKRENG